MLDAILREYDIPKIYWRSVTRTDGIQYEVVDGQQRLRTIWEYRRGDFALAKDMEDIRGMNVAGMKYDDFASWFASWALPCFCNNFASSVSSRGFGPFPLKYENSRLVA